MTHNVAQHIHMAGPPAKPVTWRKWPEEHAARFLELIAQGLSYAQIADEMNKEFGTDYSRNAMVGRATRVGVKSTYKQHHRPGPRTNKPKVRVEQRLRVVAANGNSDVKRVSAAFVAVVEPAEQVTIEGLELRHVSLLDLRKGECRFECSGQDDARNFTFCGNPVKPGSSYCSAHHAICLTLPPVSKRAPYIQHGMGR